MFNLFYPKGSASAANMWQAMVSLQIETCNRSSTRPKKHLPQRSFRLICGYVSTSLKNLHQLGLHTTRHV